MERTHTFIRLPLGMPPRQSGFTLVELMIVIALVSITVGMAVPNLTRLMDNNRLKKVANQIYNEMQRARLDAIKQGKELAIVFAPNEGAYYICSAKGADDSWALTGNTVEQKVTIPTDGGVRFGRGTATLAADGGNDFDDYITFDTNSATFNRIGAGTEGFVYLENRSGTAYVVGKEFTGFVFIKRWTSNLGWE